MFFVRINSCQKRRLTRLCVIKCNKQKFFTFRFSLFTFCCNFAHRNATNDADMTVRREKAKPQKPPTKKLQEAEDNNIEPQVKDSGTWKENLGRYLIDISKYVVTGVIITSTFKELDDRLLLFIISFVIAISALIAGLILTNKRKGN